MNCPLITQSNSVEQLFGSLKMLGIYIFWLFMFMDFKWLENVLFLFFHHLKFSYTKLIAAQRSRMHLISTKLLNLYK